MAKKPTPGPKRILPKDESAAVTVRALRHLNEDDIHREPGAEFTTTAERAAALGDTVEVIQ